MNVINIAADHGTTEAALFEAFYGEAKDWLTAGWREMAAFSSCVLQPLEWAGLLIETRDESPGNAAAQLHQTGHSCIVQHLRRVKVSSAGETRPSAVCNQ
ncbi:hypothetical protein [Yoonia sp.]|uniref:hypothetical protein n=1 Tax=Yoonia sp. TaxID=2212373 RepID=UPI00391E01D3